MTFAKSRTQKSQRIHMGFMTWMAVCGLSFCLNWFLPPKNVFPKEKKHIQSHPNFCWKKLKAKKSTRALQKRTSIHIKILCQIHMFFGLVGFGVFPSLNVFFSLPWGVGVWNFPLLRLKFPVFEVINRAMAFTGLSAGVRLLVAPLMG